MEQYAIFLNHKRGELLRAEAFFNRGLQICLPGISIKNSMSSPIYNIILKKTPQETPQEYTEDGRKLNSISYNSIIYDSNPSINNNKNHKINHIIRFILSYANFLNKSKGN